MTHPHSPNHIDYIEFPLPGGEALTRSQAFFSGVFGWTFKNWGDSYADTTDSGVGSGLAADPLSHPGQPLVVIYTDKLPAMREKVIAAGGMITRDIFSFPGGQRFHFKEPSGIELAVWSDQ